MLASLWWTEVLAGGWCTWAGTTSLLNAQGSTFNKLTLESLLGSISLLSSDHVNETEATRLLGVGIKHDRAVFHVAVLLKETRDVRLSQTGVNASDEKVGTSVASSFLLDLILDQRLADGKGALSLSVVVHHIKRKE